MKYIYDEFKTVSTDFNDPEIVAIYNEAMGKTLEKESSLAVELAIGPGTTLLEFGCGTGLFSIAAAKCGAHVTAVDPSSAMLAETQRAAQSHGVGNLKTRHGAFLSYEHDEPPVDIIVSKISFHHLPDFWKAEALCRFFECLKPGGRLYIADVIYQFDPSESDKHFDAWIDEALPKTSWPRSDFEIHINEEFSTFSWIMEGLIRRAGFHILSSGYDGIWGEMLCERPK